MIPFYPSRSDNQVVTPAAASSSVAINKSTPSVRLANSGLKICYVKLGSGAQVATSADIPVMPGESIVIGKGYDDDTCAFISPEGTTLNIQTGTGGVFNYTPSAGELGSIDLVNMTNELAKAEESTEAPNHWLVFKDGLLKRLTNAAWQLLVRAEVAPAIEAGTATATPNDTDVLPSVSAAHAAQKSTWANIKAAIYLKLYDWLIALTAKTTLADGDSLWIADAVGAASKKIAASLLMRRVKMPDGATAVYSQDTWESTDSWGDISYHSNPVRANGRIKWTRSGGVGAGGFSRDIAGIGGKTLFIKYKSAIASINYALYGNTTTAPYFIGTLPVSLTDNIAAFLIPVGSTKIYFYQPSGANGDYVDIDGIWIGDYSYLPGSGSEEGIRILDQLGDTAGVGVAASGTITSNGTAPSDGDTVTIAGKVYTYKTILGTTEGQVLIGASAAEALDNLKAAINSTGVSAVQYCAAAHPLVEATTNTDTVQTLAARSTGELGNSITLAKSAATLTLSGATLSDGYSDAAAKIITATQNNIAGSGTRPAAAKMELTNTALIGYETTVDVASGGTLTLPAGGTWYWNVYGYGATISSAKRGSSAGGTTLTVAGANASVGYRRVA